MIRNKLFIYWIFFFFIAVFILSNSHFKSSNDDSKYYSDLVVRYQNQSWQNILSPKWGVNYYSFDPATYMRDQFPAQLVLGVVVSKLGIPAEHALHVVGMIFQILSIVLLVKIAEQFLSYNQASAIYYGILLTPMAFSYNIRANHELGIMFFCFLSLYSGLTLSSSKIWNFVCAFSAVMLLMIKGPFFIFGLLLFICGYFFSAKRASLKNLFLTLALSGFSLLAIAYLYEIFYLNFTGKSFFMEFYKIQIEQRAMPTSHEHLFIVQKILNFKYYFTNYFTYSLPWCLVLFVEILKNKNKKEFIADIKKILLSELSLCLLTSALIFCFVFSLSDRTATRYVFPAYYLFSAWVLVALVQVSSKFKLFHEKIMKLGLYFIVPSLWFLAFILHFL